MHPKLAERVSRGMADAFENLLAMDSRKATRRVQAWTRGPRWLPSHEVLEAMRTSTRGLMRNQRTGASTEANELSGEILVDWTAPSTG